jgi:hypothetical protein
MDCDGIRTDGTDAPPGGMTDRAGSNCRKKAESGSDLGGEDMQARGHARYVIE